MKPRVTDGAVPNALCHDTYIFTSSLRTRTSPCLIPAFLTEENHVPYHGFKNTVVRGCLSSCSVVIFDKNVPF